MLPLPPDPYKALGVSKDAQLPEIRSAHRKLVLKCHPDKVQDAKLKEEKQIEFQRVQQAYELLSNEKERDKYDDAVKLADLRSQFSSPPSNRMPKRQDAQFHDVYEPEPRPSTFAKTGSPYGRTPPARSWEEELQTSSRYNEHRSARKTASYEKDRPSRRDEERRRRKEDEEKWARERTREKEAKKEKEREKERRRQERDDRERAQKKADKERKRETEDKRRHKTPYVEVPEGEEDGVYSTTPKTDKKKSSSSRKYEEAARDASSVTDKVSANMEFAAQYLARSGGKAPPLSRSQTQPAAPTPPPAAAAAYPPPPGPDPRERDITVEEDSIRKPTTRASGRRMSHDTPRSSKDKSKRSGSIRDGQPIIVDASPNTRGVPPFHKSHTMPPAGSAEPPRVTLSRAQTEYSRPPPAAGLHRAETWYSGERRDRSRSRHARPYSEDESDDDREYRHRRSRRTRSPEPIQVPKTVRYTVDQGRSVPIRPAYHPDEAARIYKVKASHVPNSSARVVNPSNMYTHEDYYGDDQPTAFSKVNYAQTFDEGEISYSSVPHSSTYAREVY